MKKALSLILALVMVLSLSVTAFAEDPDNSTDVTANVEMAYEMVIPFDGAVMNETNHANGVLLGTDGHTEAKIDNIKHEDTSKKVYYTATLGNFSDGANSMAATYTYAQGGNYTTLTSDTTKVYVYDGTKAESSRQAPSTIKVSVTDEVWNAAAAGTYTATVTFNFAEEEVAALPATMKIGEILDTVDDFPVKESGIPAGAWKGGDLLYCYESRENLVFDKGTDSFPIGDWYSTNLSGNDYVYTDEGITITFVMQNGKLTKIIYNATIDHFNIVNGTYTAPAAE